MQASVRGASGVHPLPDSSSSSLSSLYHTMLGTCAPATGHRISRESLTFTRRSVKFFVSRGASRATGGVKRKLSGVAERRRELDQEGLGGWHEARRKERSGLEAGWGGLRPSAAGLGAAPAGPGSGMAGPSVCGPG